MEEKVWRFCVVGNIVKQHQDADGNVCYGTKAFTGGTKVYIADDTLDWSRGTVKVIGLNRFRKYELIRMPISQIENVRLQRVFKPKVLEIMDGTGCWDGWFWRERTAEDRRTLEALIKSWDEHQRLLREMEIDEGHTEMGRSIFFAQEGKRVVGYPYYLIFPESEKSELLIAEEDFTLFGWALSMMVGKQIDVFGPILKFDYGEWKQVLEKARKMVSFETFDDLFDYLLELKDQNSGESVLLYYVNNCGADFWKNLQKYKLQLNDIEKWTQLVLDKNEKMIISGD